ncbi:MAG: peptidoglycan-binding domain-containing protein [Candidatus Paceibacterota bacterium]|jgi:peptidoglycan hydrolase-like protein with peptidoglycan-binding domain
MKKYTLYLFVFTLFITLLGFNVGTVNASNCAPGDLFNTATGQPCEISTTPIECRPGDLFSSITGKPCEGKISIPVPSCPEFNIGTKGEDVKVFQTQLNAQGASLKIDGSYGPQTRASAAIYCKNPTPNPSSVVISGVSGPQTLNVNQQGTWTVTAYDKNGGNLSYSVNWGDEVSVMPMSTSLKYFPSQQSATFTHSYSQAGIYKIVFTVKSENTIVCIKAPCPSNGGSAQTSLSVNVGNGTTPSITVLSPNGGETWTKGTNQTIYWQSNKVAQYDVLLTPHSTSCDTPTNIACPISPSLTIAKNVYSSSSNFQGSYGWSVGTAWGQNIPVSDGSYTIQVCQSGTNICDSSDSYFKITSSVPATPSITVLSPNGGETWTKGTSQTIKWQDNLSDPSCPLGGSCAPAVPRYYDIQLVPLFQSCTGTCPMNVMLQPMPYTIAKSVFNSSYEWFVGKNIDVNRIVPDGSYTIKVCKSGTDICDSSDSYFKIVSSAVPSITVLSPNGGETWVKGTTNYPVTWKWTNIINTFNMYLINSNTGERVAMVGKGVSSEEANRTVVGIADVPVNAYIIPGSYKLEICDASNDSLVCDRSDAPFSIVAVGPNTAATIDSVKFDKTTIMDAGGTANFVVSGSAMGAVSAEYTFTDTFYDGHTTTSEIYKKNFGNKDGAVFSWRYSTATLDNDKIQSVLRVTKVTVGNIEKSVSSAVITITDSSPNVLGAESFKFTQFLEEGSYGNEVRELQKFLNGAGYDAGNVDGIFGPKVKEALIKFQNANGLKSDGIVGFEVRSFLNK